MTILVIMQTVSVSELKAHLSRYLREVRRGGEVQILDRGVPVARLAGLPSTVDTDDEQQRQRLLRAGILRAGRGPATDVLETPPLELPASIVEQLTTERADRV